MICLGTGAAQLISSQMWIVRTALNRPYTFIVLALLILLISPIVIVRTPTDIFPNINIPVIAAIFFHCKAVTFFAPGTSPELGHRSSIERVF